MTDAEKIAKLQGKVAKQRSEIGRLTKQLEQVEATKRDHVFRLRQITTGALDGHMGWRVKAERELGRIK